MSDYGSDIGAEAGRDKGEEEEETGGRRRRRRRSVVEEEVVGVEGGGGGGGGKRGRNEEHEEGDRREGGGGGKEGKGREEKQQEVEGGGRKIRDSGGVEVKLGDRRKGKGRKTRDGRRGGGGGIGNEEGDGREDEEEKKEEKGEGIRGREDEEEKKEEKGEGIRGREDTRLRRRRENKEERDIGGIGEEGEYRQSRKERSSDLTREEEIQEEEGEGRDVEGKEDGGYEQEKTDSECKITTEDEKEETEHSYQQGDDQYTHPCPGLIYTDTSFPGAGLDTSDLDEGWLGACECTTNTCPDGCHGPAYQNSVLPQVPPVSPVFECNSECTCGSLCPGRLTQRGPALGLEVRAIHGKGFGLVAGHALPRGAFVCEYAGEMIGAGEAKARLERQDRGRAGAVRDTRAGESRVSGNTRTSEAGETSVSWDTGVLETGACQTEVPSISGAGASEAWGTREALGAGKASGAEASSTQKTGAGTRLTQGIRSAGVKASGAPRVDSGADRGTNYILVIVEHIKPGVMGQVGQGEGWLSGAGQKGQEQEEWVMGQSGYSSPGLSETGQMEEEDEERKMGQSRNSILGFSGPGQMEMGHIGAGQSYSTQVGPCTPGQKEDSELKTEKNSGYSGAGSGAGCFGASKIMSTLVAPCTPGHKEENELKMGHHRSLSGADSGVGQLGAWETVSTPVVPCTPGQKEDSEQKMGHTSSFSGADSGAGQLGAWETVSTLVTPCTPGLKEGSQLKTGHPRSLSGANSGAGQTITTIIDPTITGNLGRYANHSCAPNMALVPVRIDHMSLPRPALFTTRGIRAGEELCYDYGSSHGAGAEGDIGEREIGPGLTSPSALGKDSVGGSHSSPHPAPLSSTPCLCGASVCRGFLPAMATFGE